MAASTNEDEAISKLTQHIEDLSTNNDIILEVCVNCGKEVINNPNTCNKCKAATYCNASCKKKHRSKHKQECKKRVAELYEEQLERERRAAELRDRELFKPPRRLKIVQFVCCLCHHLKWGRGTNHAAER